MANAKAKLSSMCQGLPDNGALRRFRSVAGSPEARIDTPFGAHEPDLAEVVTKPRNFSSAPASARSTPASSDNGLSASVAASQTNVSHSAQTNAQLLTENVTVPLSATLRDRSEEVARILNRSRTERKVRITRNTVIRVALQVFVEGFEQNPAKAINNEDDLLAFARACFWTRTVG